MEITEVRVPVRRQGRDRDGGSDLVPFQLFSPSKSVRYQYEKARWLFGGVGGNVLERALALP